MAGPRSLIPERTDWRFAAVIVVLSVAALIFSEYLIAPPPLVLDEEFSALSPRVFPTLIVAGTGIVAALFLLSEALRPQQPPARDPGDGAPAVTPGWRHFGFLALVTACAVLLDRAGFLTTAAILTAGTAVLAGNRSPVQIVIVSLLAPLVLYVLITHVLQTPLPGHALIEGELTPFLQRLPGL